MPNQFKPILTEFLWLIIALLATLLVTGFIFRWNFLENSYNIRLQDGFFVFSRETIIIPLFLLAILFIFCVKEARNSFGQTLPNFIILVSGLLLILYLTSFSQELTRLSIINKAGWTAYPPLAVLPERFTQHRPEESLTNMTTNVVMGFQLSVAIGLLYTCFRWGMHRKHKN